MSIRRRLARLEDQGVRAALPGSDPVEQERRRQQFSALHREIERHRNGGEGPEPQTDLETEREVIEHVIPRYRFAEGWQTGEAREFLDSWERRAREKIESFERSKT